MVHVIDWSGISRDTVLGRALRYPLRWLPDGTVVTVRQGLNAGYKWVSGSSVHGCWLGSYELDKQKVLGRYAKPGMTAFDLGANAGFYTLAFSRLVGARGQVWAFEPLAENVVSLRRHVRLNELRNVTILQVAVSDRAGFAPFEPGENSSTGRLVAGNSSYDVPTAALDELIAAGTCAAPDIVKVDVEGAEAAVLGGAVELVRSKRATWVISLHGGEQRARCVERLAAAGYRLSTFGGVPWAQAPGNAEELLAVPS